MNPDFQWSRSQPGYYIEGFTGSPAEQNLCVRLYISVSQELFRELLLHLFVRLHRIDTVVTWRQMRLKYGISFSNKGQRTSI